MIEIPEPGKRGWGHPLPEAALGWYVHPDAGHRFGKVFADSLGNVVAFNGALAVRVRSFVSEEVVRAGWVGWDELLGAPALPEAGCDRDGSRWRRVDEDSGRLWTQSPKAVWLEAQKGLPFLELNRRPAVRVGEACVVPLGLMQLAARLPGLRVCVDNRFGGPLRMTWKGGEAVIAPVEGLPPASFGMLTPRKDARGMPIYGTV